MMPNEGEFKKSVHKKFRYCLGLSEFIISLMTAFILAEEIQFFSTLGDLHDLDLG